MTEQRPCEHHDEDAPPVEAYDDGQDAPDNVLKLPKPKKLDIEQQIHLFIQSHSVVYHPRLGWYIYESGYWRSYSEDTILHLLTIQLGAGCPLSGKRWVLDGIRNSPLVFKKDYTNLNIKPEWLNLINGMLDPITLTLHPHDPKYLSTFRLPVSYDPEAECPEFTRFLSENIDTPEEIAVLGEFGGYCLIPSCSRGKALIMEGATQSGKGTTANVIRSLLGHNNCSSEQWHNLEEPFHAISLHPSKSICNISDEMSPARMKSTAMFKSIVSGETVTDSEKGQPRISFRPRAKLIFNTNSVPNTGDDTAAFYFRLLVVGFPHSHVTKETRDEEYFSRLLLEMPGILNWALAGLARLNAQDGFTHSPKMIQFIHHLKIQNSQILQFVEECCVLSSYEFVSKNDLYMEYTGWAVDQNVSKRYIKTKQWFFRDLNSEFNNLKPYRDSTGKEDRSVYGIRLRTPADGRGDGDGDGD